MQEFLEPYGYTSDDAGFLLVLVVLMCIVGNGVLVPLVGKTLKYKASILIYSTISMVLLCFVEFVLVYGNLFLVSLIFGVIGLFGWSCGTIG